MIQTLDRAIWNALTARQADVAVRRGKAVRLGDGYGVFLATADREAESLADAAALLPDQGELAFFEIGDWPIPPGATVVRTAECVQMVAERLTPGPAAKADILDLGEADAEEMLALATLTRPGPFMARTHRLGAFVGIRVDGQLVAMAGERLRPPGFTEVSGVCTHPDHRGHGHAAALMRRVAQRILDRGETPFLHAYADNPGAIGLYESLGFAIRARATLTVITRAG